MSNYIVPIVFLVTGIGLVGFAIHLYLLKRKGVNLLSRRKQFRVPAWVNGGGDRYGHLPLHLQETVKNLEETLPEINWVGHESKHWCWIGFENGTVLFVRAAENRPVKKLRTALKRNTGVKVLNIAVNENDRIMVIEHSKGVLKVDTNTLSGSKS